MLWWRACHSNAAVRVIFKDKQGLLIYNVYKNEYANIYNKDTSWCIQHAQSTSLHMISMRQRWKEYEEWLPMWFSTSLFSGPSFTAVVSGLWFFYLLLFNMGLHLNFFSFFFNSETDVIEKIAKYNTRNNT